MYVVMIKLHAIRDGESATGVAHLEERIGDSWKRVKVWNMISGGAEEERRLVVADNQRVVFEGKGGTRTVFDRQQNAAVPVPWVDERMEQEIEQEHARRAIAEDLAEHRRLQALDAAAKRLRERREAQSGDD